MIRVGRSLLAANAYREDVERTLSSGMNGRIAKPVDIKALMRVLQERLNKWIVLSSKL
ncbi:hypothetical protein ACYULU_13450 [Breznakiellaceae bacterium SP9]